MNCIVFFLVTLVVGDSLVVRDNEKQNEKAMMILMKKQLCRPITCNKCQKLITKWAKIAKPTNVSIFVQNPGPSPGISSGEHDVPVTDMKFDPLLIFGAIIDTKVDQSSFRMHIQHVKRSPSHTLLDQSSYSRLWVILKALI